MRALQLHTALEKPEILKLGLTHLSTEECVKRSILSDLLNLNWKISFNNSEVVVTPPEFYDKKTIRHSMSVKRNEIIRNNRAWINKYIYLARENLADGVSALQSEIIPVIEVCKTQRQHRLFRIFRYYWSSPYSDYVGRRIKLLIKDAGVPNQPVIGIAAIGSPIIHIPERDSFIGWDKTIRTKNLIYAMDAYVIGALPPYNYLLGGKLISYLLATREVRKIYEDKYKDQVTLINKRKANDLACLFTTSLYGKSSQYNRLKYDDKLLYQPIGETKGYGTLHLTEETINLMRKYLAEKQISIGYKFGDGPSWRMRVIRTVGDMLNFDSDFLLKHSFKRTIYYTPLAENSITFLRGVDKHLIYKQWSQDELVNYWKERWLRKRKQNLSIINKAFNFSPSAFEIA